MKTTMATILSGLMFLAMGGLAQGQAPAGKTEKAIRALETQWEEAQKKNNPDLVAPLLADKFMYTGFEGSLMDKAAFLADAKSFKYTNVAYSEETIAVFGSTAVARGKSKLTVSDASGKSMDYSGRYTDVWVKMPDGKWQCVSSQDSPSAK